MVMRLVQRRQVVDSDCTRPLRENSGKNKIRLRGITITTSIDSLCIR